MAGATIEEGHRGNQQYRKTIRHAFGVHKVDVAETYPSQSFQFDRAVCGGCPLRSQRVAAREGKGRPVTLHPQEALLQQARAFQESPASGEYRWRRQVAEHRPARLAQLGARQPRAADQRVPAAA